MAAPDPRKAEAARQRRAALKKQVRHPYITGQELKGSEPVPSSAPTPVPPKAPPPA